MSDKLTDLTDNMDECRKKSWMMAAGGGVVMFILVLLLSGFDFLTALISGLLFTGVLGMVLVSFRCGDTASPRSTSNPVTAPATTAPAADPEMASAKAPDPAPAPEAPATLVSETPAANSDAKVKPSAALAGQDELASRKGSWKYGEGDGEAPAKTPAASTSADESEPALMQSPRDGSGDNLKLIGGVGPKLEQTLNELGIWHFDQVAAWGPEEIAWVDNRLRFKGRIERDNWIDQAKTLAAGGETEFSRKKKG
ncbi:endonuclease [Sulfitobacter sp. D35]|uniref:endonuclease n=1 Tax=Sulfitobacter sp. D35 TaxID=3083252 RepID=UPI00296E81F8|nr:endonuclease [Sulfitobacter sp. D35]MDW4496896.1 endonuclease [Sulfitobacter sp. D35]